jgi:hypothetical protein
VRIRPGRSPLKLAVVAFLVGLLAGCAGPLEPEAAAAPCWPAFPYRDGWLGGDAAYSIPLSPSRTIWLFGDSFVGAPGQRDRQGAAFVHNSIGLSRCELGGRWQIEYAWGRSLDGSARDFLERGEPEAWWWLFDGFLHEGRLYLGLLEVEHAPPRGPLAMPFAITGTQLGRIPNPHDDPADWRMEVVVLTPGPAVLTAGAMVLHDGYVFFFNFHDLGDGAHPRSLARLPLRALDGETRDVSNTLQYLARDGAWKPGFDSDDARVLMDDAATEMSVRFHDGLGRWLALYSYPDVGDAFPETPPADAVWIRTAERLEGPWSERRLLFRVPELDPAQAGGHDPNTGCYAAKEHPQFSSGRRLAFTYVCNLFTGRGQDPMQILGRLLVDMDLYRPIPVAVDLPSDL